MKLLKLFQPSQWTPYQRNRIIKNFLTRLCTIAILGLTIIGFIPLIVVHVVACILSAAALLVVITKIAAPNIFDIAIDGLDDGHVMEKYEVFQSEEPLRWIHSIVVMLICMTQMWFILVIAECIVLATSTMLDKDYNKLIAKIQEREQRKAEFDEKQNRSCQ